MRRPFWIKERYNPQLGTYYVGMGQLSKTAAMKYQRSIYGSNVMHRFDSEEEYKKRIRELENEGQVVQ